MGRGGEGVRAGQRPDGRLAAPGPGAARGHRRHHRRGCEDRVGGGVPHEARGPGRRPRPAVQVAVRPERIPLGDPLSGPGGGAALVLETGLMGEIGLVERGGWVRGRGVVMFVADGARGRADVSRPWREHAARADSYFAWSFGLTVAALTGGIVLLVAAALVGIRMARGHGSLAAGIAALVVLVGVVLVLLILSALASPALRDFVAPLQMRTASSCGTAVTLFLGLLRAHPGTFAVYVLLKIVFALVLGFVVTVAACLTCCCALIPVVTQTLLQPAFYFERAWPLCLLRQLGYDLLPPVPIPPV